MAGMSTLAGHRLLPLHGYGGGTGFNAITVALLGPQQPIGVVLGSLLFAALITGGRYMQAATGIPIDLTTVIQAVIVFWWPRPRWSGKSSGCARPATGKILLFTKGWAG